MLYFAINCEIIFFTSLTSISENTPKIRSIGPLITEKRTFKKLKILSILVHFISKIKKPDIFNFPSIKYFVKYFLFLKTWNWRVNCCGNYRPSNLLFCFTGDNLEKNYFFWKLVSKGVSGRSFKISDLVTVKWRPFEIFSKLNGKLLLAFWATFRKSKTCVFNEMHNFG